MFSYNYRHSRFGGTYIVQNMKATGENQMICHKPYQKIETLEFGHNKVNVANRLVMHDFCRLLSKNIQV